MSAGESTADRRRRLLDQIHRQRQELGHAYLGLAKPLQYTQTAIVGLQALKKNAWLVALSPTVVSLIFTFFGWKKDKKGGLFDLVRGKTKRQVAHEAEETAGKARQPMARLLKHGWSLFQFYRKVRPYFP